MADHFPIFKIRTLRHTSVGRKFAPVEGLSHDLVCTGSIYHVHFAWQVWHGQLSPRFKFDKLKSFSGVTKRILGGKGFAVGRLKRHNFCPASVGLSSHKKFVFHIHQHIAMDKNWPMLEDVHCLR